MGTPVKSKTPMTDACEGEDGNWDIFRLVITSRNIERKLAAAKRDEELFQIELCDALFGCFLERTQDDDGVWISRCTFCEETIDVTNWVHAKHEADCIVNKARDYLVIHKPEAVPARKP